MKRLLSYRRFTLLFILALTLFVLYHLSVWYFLTSKIFNAAPYYIGDLGRMSYQIDSLSPRAPEMTLTAKHYEGEEWDHRPVDLVTLGDSFSNGMGGGKNPYYQDYLAQIHDLRVLNIQNLDPTFGYIDTVRTLLKHGWLKGTRCVLIECVGRESLLHLSGRNPKRLFSPQELNRSLFRSSYTTEFPKTMMINTGNYKAPYYHLAYRYSVNAKKEIYKLPLTQPMFSVIDAQSLLIYHDDLRKITDFTPEKIKTLNQELNTLADELRQEGIALIFMPAVDKYDLYYPYLSDQKGYPKNPFFDLLRNEPKRYHFIDTKAILEKALERGVDDLYYADDTHWSFKASETIAKSLDMSYLIPKGGQP